MSSGGYSIRSHARPYFAVWSATRGLFISNNQFADELDFVIEFALYAYPAQYADPIDQNALACLFVDRFVGSVSQVIVSVGITPFGGICVENSPGQIALTPQGVVPADGKFRTLHVTCSGAAVAAVTLDDVTLAITNTGAVGPAAPSGYNTGLMLFNDFRGRARLNAAIRRVTFTNDNLQMEYPLREGRGNIVAPGALVDLDGVLAASTDTKLYASWYNPNIELLYGPVPDGDASEAFHWQLQTEYRHRPRPQTNYRRRRTTWLV